MIKEYGRIAYKSVKYRKLRSFLTIIGILIGIGAIVSLITVSQGFGNFIDDQLEGVGTTRVFLLPKLSGLTIGEGLTTKDVKVAESMVGVDWVNPYLINAEEVEFKKTKGFVQQIMGIETNDLKDKLETFGVGLDAGRYLIDGERNSVMIGYKMSNDFFDDKILVNNQIEIKDKKFKVVGIFEEIGNPDDDNMVLLAMDDMRDLFDKKDEVNFVEIKVEEGVDLALFAETFAVKLEAVRDDDFFTILTPEQQAEQIGSLLGVVGIVLGSIAGISLVVGSIGITNSMFTSVLERTKDIGTMKAIGAKNRDIMVMFLLEAGFIGLLGGVIGVVLGNLSALLIQSIAEQSGFILLNIKVDYTLSIGGIIFAVLLSSASGFVPAYRASKLKPVEAMRYG